ncbi:STAS domain-containing protein [Streptomyces sp. NPDC059786]|uniref:STAS domain-containing protein n=1 Tax=Streptomyces sp. NPDC059786 TaxID=3346946 RepID=UPI0036621F45
MQHGGDGTVPARVLPGPVPGGPVLRRQPLGERPGLRMAGEISPPTRALWRAALRELASRPDTVCFLELSSVTFVDVAGASDLAHTAQGLAARRRFVVERPPAELARLLGLFWPELRTIEVVA